MKPRVRVIAVGGTISSVSADPHSLASPAYSGEDLITKLPGIEDLAEVEVENFSRVLSSQLSIEQVYQLSRRIRDIFLSDPKLAGIVVTHGTGTIEESAFMADLMVEDQRPVVFTGAMRHISDPFTDGYFNLYNAIRVVISPEATGKGVMAVFNGVIHPARDVFKSHTTGADTFKSGEFGPLGYVYPDRIHFTRAPLLRVKAYTESPELNVDLIKFVVGMDDRFIRCSVSSGAKGIVIEGSGLGNVNESVAEGIDYAVQNGVTVVVCSRCTDGRVFPSYGTKAAAAALIQKGCILASLPGPKARILLMLGLGISKEREVLQSLFDPHPDRILEREI